MVDALEGCINNGLILFNILNFLVVYGAYTLKAELPQYTSELYWDIRKAFNLLINYLFLV